MNFKNKFVNIRVPTIIPADNEIRNIKSKLYIENKTFSYKPKKNSM